MAANVAAMEAFAIPLFRAGHVPLVGEWLGLPLAALAGSKRIGDAAFAEVFHPIAERLLERCDAVSASAAHRRGRIGWSPWRRLGGWRSITRYTRCPGAQPPQVELCAA